MHPCLKITPVRHEPLRVRGCSPAWVAASQGVWFQGRGHGSLHKDMESSRDNARGIGPSPGEIRTIPADPSQLKTCHGHFHHTIYTLFKRKSLFKPKSQEASSPECQSRLVAPHQEPFAPMFENHTGSSRTVASSWLLPGLGGREPGSLVSGERARIAPQRHGIISRQCQRE